MHTTTFHEPTVSLLSRYLEMFFNLSRTRQNPEVVPRSPWQPCSTMTHHRTICTVPFLSLRKFWTCGVAFFFCSTVARVWNQEFWDRGQAVQVFFTCELNRTRLREARERRRTERCSQPTQPHVCSRTWRGMGLQGLGVQLEISPLSLLTLIRHYTSSS